MTTTTGRGIGVTSPKLIFTDSGKNCYAYSGELTFSNTETTLLLFTTTDEPIHAQLSTAYSATDGASTSQDAFFRIYFSDVLLMTITFNESGLYQNTTHYDFIIPPNTTVKITGKNTTDDSSLDFFASIRGRTLQ